MQFSNIILSALIGMAASAAVAPRQIGNLACNVARLQIVGALGSAGDAIGQIQDTATQTAAQTGLDQANGGIKQIAGAILTGQQAPAEGRDAVAAGLQAMATALSATNRYVILLIPLLFISYKGFSIGYLAYIFFFRHLSTDSAVADAQAALTKASAAGQDVVSECK